MTDQTSPGQAAMALLRECYDAARTPLSWRLDKHAYQQLADTTGPKPWRSAPPTFMGLPYVVDDRSGGIELLCEGTD